MTQLVAEIVGDASKFNKATSDATSHAETLTSKLQNVGKGMVIGAGIAAFNLLTDAVSIGISKLGEAHEAFLADEASQKLLGQALQNNIPNWDGNIAGAEEYAAAQAKLGFADDEVRASLGQLIGVTHDLSEAQKLNTLAQELARAKGIDLATATDLVTKAHEGNGRALKGLGIDITGLTTGAEFLDAVQKNVAGSAETWAATNEGKLAVSNVKVGEAMEKVGGIVDKAAQVLVPILADALVFLSDTFSQVWDAIQPVISAIAEGLQPVIEALAPVVGSVFGGIKSTVQSVAPVFKAVFDGIGAAVGFVTGTVFPSLQSAIGAIASAFGGLASFVGAVWSSIGSAIRGAINGVIAAVNGIISRINGLQVHIHLDLPDPLPNINFDWYGLRLGYLPYLHAGGIVPGAPGEDVLAILQAGERVIPAAEAGGSGGGSPVVIQLIVDGNELGRIIDRRLYYASRSRTKFLPD